MSLDTPTVNEESKSLSVTAGPYWESFEQFRVAGPKQLQERLGPDAIGRLNVKGQEYVIMRSETFNRLYGLAQEVRRLSRGLLLIRQAVQLVLHTDGAKVAVEHLRDLTFQLPDLRMEGHKPRDLTFEAGEEADERELPEGNDFEIDPARVRRPAFGGEK
jgi:hypothetical protein